MRPYFTGIVSTITCILLFASCGGPKKVVYFNENLPPDSSAMVQSIVQHSDARILPDDIVAINVASINFFDDSKANMVFQEGGLSFGATVATGSTGSGAGGSTGAKNSFLVDSAGFIEYPRLGKIKLGGLSITEAKEMMGNRLKDYIKQPVVEVRIVNYRVTMLGEITNGPIIAPNHKLTIVDAIAAAGGIGLTGRKDNILIIRETNGKREFGHIDLNSRNLFNSPYYYLKQNDIVYVEPSRIRKQEANEFLRFYLPTVTTLLATAVSTYALILASSK
jgi:polysaccharide export outer membrane protein